MQSPTFVVDAVTFDAEHPIYFDGGASPNPGPMLVAIVHGATAVLLELDGIEGGNNEAEFRAALVALDHAAANALRRPVIAGDSDAVISALRARHPPKPGRLTSLYQECAARDAALGGAIWQRVPRDNPAGRLIQVERRRRKTVRRSARLNAGQALAKDQILEVAVLRG